MEECVVCGIRSDKVKYYKVVEDLDTGTYQTVCHRCWLDWEKIEKGEYSWEYCGDGRMPWDLI